MRHIFWTCVPMRFLIFRVHVHQQQIAHYHRIFYAFLYLYYAYLIRVQATHGYGFLNRKVKDDDRL